MNTFILSFLLLPFSPHASAQDSIDHVRSLEIRNKEKNVGSRVTPSGLTGNGSSGTRGGENGWRWEFTSVAKRIYAILGQLTAEQLHSASIEFSLEDFADMIDSPQNLEIDSSQWAQLRETPETMYGLVWRTFCQALSEQEADCHLPQVIWDRLNTE